MMNLLNGRVYNYPENELHYPMNNRHNEAFNREDLAYHQGCYGTSRNRDFFSRNYYSGRYPSRFSYDDRNVGFRYQDNSRWRRSYDRLSKSSAYQGKSCSRKIRHRSHRSMRTSTYDRSRSRTRYRCRSRSRSRHSRYRTRRSRTRSRSASRARRRHRRREKSRQRRRDREKKKKERRDTTDEESSDDSADDSVGHHQGKAGDTLNSRFIIEKEIGVGTFGRVLRCTDSHNGRKVAVKVVRRVERYCDSAKIEADILYDISCYAEGKKLCSQIIARFLENGHYCIVLEELGRSLYDYLKENSYKGFPLDYVRSFSGQLLDCMTFLKSINLIHTDLKPENILIASRDDEIINVDGCAMTLPRNRHIKVIDFGGATYDDEHKSSIVNTRQYRGPEVILGLGWSFPSDLWSCGCIIAEIFSGELFFGTHSNIEHLALMEKSLGRFPAEMISESRESSKYFNSKGVVRADVLSKQNMKRVDEMPTIQNLVGQSCESGFDLVLEGLLRIDPTERVEAPELLMLPFFQS